VEFKNKFDTSNNRGDWDYYKITQTVTEQNNGKAANYGITKKQSYCALHITVGCAGIRVKKYNVESKSKGKIHLTALIEVTVSNFTYNFSTQSPCNTMQLLYRSTSFCIPAEKKLFDCAMLMADQNDLHQ